MIFAAIEMIPKKVYAALVVALLLLLLAAGAAAGYMKVKVAIEEAKFSRLETKVANEATERERVAREDAIEVSRMQSKHASLQQESVHAFQKQAATDASRVAADRADDSLLRDVVRSYAAGGPEAQGDTAACRSELDRAQRLGGLVEEALGLQGESESFIRQRDREVKLLKDLIGNDRALLAP